MLKHYENMWENVLKTALLSTERQPLALPGRSASQQDDKLAALLSGLDMADREGALLGTAASLMLYARAGQLPTTGSGPLPEPCPADDAPRCSARRNAPGVAAARGESRSFA